MEYILNPEKEGIDFERYAAYVESTRHRLPPHVYVFASDPRYFDLVSYSSLHDAWLEAVTVREVATGERQETRRTEIAISLFGPYHDRLIHLQYLGVTRYSLSGRKEYENAAHGDLFTHEIRLSHDNLLVHEILFRNDATFMIECSDIRHSEEIIPGAREG